MKNTFDVAEGLDRASALLKSKKYSDAYDLACTLLEAEPHSLSLLRIAGYACIGLREHNQALDFLSKAQSIDSDPARGWSALGTAYLKFGNVDKAHEYFNKSLESSENYYPEACQGLIDLAIGTNDTRKIIKQLKKILKLMPLDSKGTTKWLSLLVNYEGPRVRHLKMGEIYRRTYPNDLRIYEFLVNTSLSLSEPGKAMDYIAEMELCNGETAESNSLKLKALRFQLSKAVGLDVERLKAEILGVFKKCSEFNSVSCSSSDSELLIQQGELLRNEELIEDGRAIVDTPAKIQALDFFLAAAQDTKNFKAQERAIDMLIRMKAYPQALQILEQWQKRAGESQDVLLLKARLLRETKDFVGSVAQVRKILRDTPDHKGALIMLAEEHHRVGDIQSAYPIYSQLSESDYVSEGLARGLGATLFESGSMKRALRAFEPAISRKKSAHWVGDYLNEIDSRLQLKASSTESNFISRLAKNTRSVRRRRELLFLVFSGGASSDVDITCESLHRSGTPRSRILTIDFGQPIGAHLRKSCKMVFVRGGTEVSRKTIDALFLEGADYTFVQSSGDPNLPFYESNLFIVPARTLKHFSNYTFGEAFKLLEEKVLTRPFLCDRQFKYDSSDETTLGNESL
jgi:tetratricopeptide (TPR) repeat protein